MCHDVRTLASTNSSRHKKSNTCDEVIQLLNLVLPLLDSPPFLSSPAHPGLIPGSLPYVANSPEGYTILSR